jgi:hypothetical protein
MINKYSTHEKLNSLVYGLFFGKMIPAKANENCTLAIIEKSQRPVFFKSSPMMPSIVL